MKLLGTIQFTQIQQSPLKVPRDNRRVYDPAPIKQIEHLQLTPGGILGLESDGTPIIDVHHLNHPRSRNRGNANGISLNFLVNYERMKARYPASPITTGDGGENLVITPETDFTIEMIDSVLAIETQDGDIIYLKDIMAIPPCAEFSCFLAGEVISGEQMRQTLEFLSDGTRGFYATLGTEQENAIIRAGDKLYAV